MRELELIYEGKSKLIYSTDSNDRVVIRFKDDATAFYNIKRAKIENKGKMCCAISSMLLSYLNKNGVNTHFVEQVDAERTRPCFMRPTGASWRTSV